MRFTYIDQISYIASQITQYATKDHDRYPRNSSEKLIPILPFAPDGRPG